MQSFFRCPVLRSLRPPCLRPTTGARRTLFGLPDISSFAPFPGGDVPEETYHERKILPYTRRQLYEIVSDVPSYPHFVPYCTSARILTPAAAAASRHADNSAGAHTMDAELTVGFGALTESYVSRVTCRPYESVEAAATSSTPLFKSLSTIWRFQPASARSPHPSAGGGPHHDGKPEADDAPTLVTLDLTYAFASPVHAAVSKAFFGKVSQMMVEAFEKRCLEVYGKGDT